MPRAVTGLNSRAIKDGDWNSVLLNLGIQSSRKASGHRLLVGETKQAEGTSCQGCEA